MSLITRRTDPSLMWSFLLSLVFLAVYAAAYALLTEPLHRLLTFPGKPLLSSVIHIIIISSVGSAVCCLAFFLPNRRIPLLAFGWVAFFFVLLFALSLIFFEGEKRANLFTFLLGFALGPALIGNGFAWGIRLLIKRKEDQ